MSEMTNREARRFDESQAAAERAQSRPTEPLARITPAEYERAMDVMHNAVRLYASHALSPKATVDLAALKAELVLQMESAARCRDLLHQPIERAAPGLTNAQRAESLIAGVIAIAQTLRGGWCFGSGKEIDHPRETLLERLITVSPDAAFWRQQSPGLVVNLVREPAIAEALEGQGVLAWAAQDGGARVVRVNWLEAPVEISEYVKAEPEPGRRCRFCRAFEPDHSMELESFDRPEKRPTVTSTGWAGRKRVLDYSHLSVHARCRPYWERWLEIAANFEPGPPEAA